MSGLREDLRWIDKVTAWNTSACSFNRTPEINSDNSQLLVREHPPLINDVKIKLVAFWPNACKLVLPLRQAPMNMIIHSHIWNLGYVGSEYHSMWHSQTICVTQFAWVQYVMGSDKQVRPKNHFYNVQCWSKVLPILCHDFSVTPLREGG